MFAHSAVNGRNEGGTYVQLDGEGNHVGEDVRDENRQTSHFKINPTS